MRKVHSIKVLCLLHNKFHVEVFHIFTHVKFSAKNNKKLFISQLSVLSVVDLKDIWDYLNNLFRKESNSIIVRF